MKNIKELDFQKDFQKLFKPIREKTLRAIGTELTRRVKRKLTNDYLSVNTGRLRNNTGIIFTKNKEGELVLNFGTRIDYGVAYETGIWDNVKSKPYKRKNHISTANAVWKGKKKRPFLTDTLNESDNAVRNIVERNLKI